MDEDEREEQAIQLTEWFAFWSKPTRVAFLQGLLDRTETEDGEEGKMMDELAVSSISNLEQNQAREILQAYTWFRSWPDVTRNSLMDMLETIDMAAVYDFYDKFAKVQWKH